MAGLVGAAVALSTVLWLGACATRSAPEPIRSSPAPVAEVSYEQPLREPLRVRDVGFDTPESVLHDPLSDRYLVSNIVGAALDHDDRAFITRVRPDGSIEALHWIDASQPGVELNAPKGMALHGDVLFVADIEHVRKFDRTSGRPLGSIALLGAAFLNDLAIDQSGVLYASDSGLGPGYTPSGADAVHRLEPSGSARPLARSPELGGPSGLVAQNGGLWVASFAAGELFFLNARGERSLLGRPPRGSLDGLALWRGRLFVSSWEGAAVYERTAEGFEQRIGDLDAPADLAIDERRGRLLVTHYRENALSIHPL
jgi:hypothetical protein